MKTIEEKAKAYDEIIERAKTMLAAGEVMYGKENNASQLITDIIPELRESEDERIRKDIVALIKFALKDGSAVSPGSHTTKEEALAWLEKQKEQRVSHLHPEDYPMTPGECIKPAWSEEDEKNFLSLCEFFTTWSKKHYTAYGRQEAMEEWLFNRFKYLNPQPKQEWSEEDQEAYRIVLNYFRQIDDGRSSSITGREVTAIHRFLENLTSQPHWEPSEQEKGALRTAVYVLTEERNFPRAASHLQAILDAFDGKESRKDWKPSEKDMNTIWLAIQALNWSGYNSLCCRLNALRDDLLKLK